MSCQINPLFSMALLKLELLFLVHKPIIFTADFTTTSVVLSLIAEWWLLSWKGS